MRLFTSNFKVFKPLIAQLKGFLLFRPLGVCVGILLLYQILILGNFIPPSEGINQWQNNVIKAESYFYGNYPRLKGVMVGSSLTANLTSHFQRGEIMNLGMAGGCSQTGLAIIEGKDAKPPLILLEMNETIDRKLDRSLVDSLTHPVISPFRHYFTMLREEYKPVSVFVSILKGKPENDQERSRESLRQQEINRIIQENQQPLTPDLATTLRQEAAIIKGEIAQLQQAGVKIILYDLPGEKSIYNTQRQGEIRELLRSLFPSNTYEWLTPPPGNWLTSDGLHLIKSDAAKFATFIREQL